jgi:hypothetical protein
MPDIPSRVLGDWRDEWAFDLQMFDELVRAVRLHKRIRPCLGCKNCTQLDKELWRSLEEIEAEIKARRDDQQ